MPPGVGHTRDWLARPHKSSLGERWHDNQHIEVDADARGHLDTLGIVPPRSQYVNLLAAPLQ